MFQQNLHNLENHSNIRRFAEYFYTASNNKGIKLTKSYALGQGKQSFCAVKAML